MNRDETYKPTIVTTQMGTAYAEFLLEVESCPTCGKYMLSGDMNGLAPAFPKYYIQKLDKQLAAANMTMKSAAKNKQDHYICVECAEKGLASFVCHLCKQERPTTEIEESFGDPPDYLCKVCYASVSAETWDKATDALHEAHRYDYC